MVAAVAAEPPPAALVRRHVVLGHSVRGRPIVAVEVGDPSSPRKVLVVGCIHGNEPAGIDIARALAEGRQPTGVDLWVVPSLNPDGVAATTRQNAHGVDLNRNFPLDWRPIDPPGGTYYAGPRALSEPESRIAAGLIRRLRPRLSIWFHQHLGLVDESGGSVALEQRFARLVDLPLRRLQRYPGSVTSWENHTLPGSSAFVVELGSGRLSAPATRLFARAVASVARR
jgi:protein MpaA